MNDELHSHNTQQKLDVLVDVAESPTVLLSNEFGTGIKNLPRPSFFDDEDDDERDDSFEEDEYELKAYNVGTTKLPVFTNMYSEKREHASPAHTDSHISEFDTIPMMVLKDISSRQGIETPVMQSELSGAASGAAIVGLGNIIGSILKFGSNYLLQVGFGAALYGLYSVGFALVQLIASLSNLGLSDTTIRYTAIYQSKQQRRSFNGLLTFSTVIAVTTGLLGTLFLLFFSSLFAKANHQPALSPLMQLMSPLVFLLCVQTVWLGSLQGLKLFKERIIVERILMPTMLFLLAFACFFFYRNVFTIALATILSTAAGTIASASFLYQACKRVAWRARKRFKAREWMSFATFNFLTSITEVVLESIDTLLLVLLAVTDLQIGQYNAAVKISDFIAMPLFSLNTMFAPTIAELHNKGENFQLGVMYKVVNKWIITFSLPIFCIAAIFSEPLLQLSGRTFINAWPLLVVSAVGSMVNAATGSVGYMLLMTGHQKVSFFNSVMSVTLNIIFGVILIPTYGAMGTALGTAITLIIMNIVRYFQVRLLLHLQPYSWDVLKPLGAGLLSASFAGGLLFLLRNANLFIHLSLVPVFMLGYIGCLFLFKASPEDKIILDSLRKKFLRR